MTKEKFEKIVNEGIGAIPKRFLEKLDNVDICIEDEPTSYQLEKLRVEARSPRPYSLIFGLYEGIPQTERRRYSQILPDKITIFKKPIERAVEAAGSSRPYAEIKEIVKNTVWHEIAHHFGMNEQRVREAEKKRNQN